MPDTDYALAWDFIDDAGDGRPYQLRFRKKRYSDTEGILIAEIASRGRPDNGTIIQISRDGVKFDDVESALKGWQTWARINEYQVSLSAIQTRIAELGLT
ncbi:MAG: hypothetical protein PHQ28_00240 [Mycobacterium sp.]|nr:hypothetical protein [Mycobacterium sp.]